jgi:hypothetical protein
MPSQAILHQYQAQEAHSLLIPPMSPVEIARYLGLDFDLEACRLPQLLTAIAWAEDDPKLPCVNNRY